jgi:ACT domain-containing protein
MSYWIYIIIYDKQRNHYYIGLEIKKLGPISFLKVTVISCVPSRQNKKHRKYNVRAREQKQRKNSETSILFLTETI